MTKKSKYDMPAVQNFAFGGIANPVQRAMLRGSDKQYLSDRQKELDAFEEQRLAYNDQLTKWQTEVYNPYKAQADAYNTAAQRYNEEVYNPYKTQYDTYLKSIEAYNAGPRTEDYSGPAAPTLTREFGMTAPATPTMFDRTAPVLPFKEEEVQARQQLAAERAREDASNRSVAIDVVSDPDKFNFGSMSVSNRFMAKGGEVTDDSDDRAASAIIKDFEAYGYTKEEIMELADKVAQAGRGGDELLAYLSPESVEFLKSKGGSGTINPITGLPEFKGGVIGKIVGAIKRVFNPRSAAAPAAKAAEPDAATPAATGPTAAELAKQLDDANKAREALATKNALELTTLKEQQAAALKAQQEASTAAQQLAIQNALKADADARAKAALPISNVINQTNAPGGLTGALALSLMYRSTQGGVPTAELEKYGGYSAVSKAAAAAGFNPTPKWIDSYEKSMKMPESEYTKRNKLFFSPGGGGYNNPDAGSWDGITPGGGYVPLPKAALTALPSIGTTQKTTNVTSLPANFSTIGASSGIGKIDLGGPLDVGWSRYLDKERDDERKKTPVTGSMFGDTGQRTDITSEQIPVTQPTLYQTKGVGQVGQVGAVGDVGGINITGPASPIFGTSPISRGGAATDPNSYFGMSQTSNPGINAGTTALGPSSLPVAGAVNTLNTIGANPNLSPTMLGGANNAGFFTDRLGNKIVAPGMGPLKPPGFAKGGDIDLQALLAQNTETLSDEKPEETINTNPVGTAQKYLADISSAGKPSPTRQSIKRTKTSAGGGATAEKAMQLAYEDLAKGDLGAMKDRPPAMRNTESARSQMEELARVYQMKIRSAQNAAKGLSADTFGAPTLEGPTLTKGSLTKKRFKDGGEAKKADAESAQEPGIFGVTDYATKASARMFPEQMGQDDQRDAARHMLAAAVLAKKTGPGTAIFLGKAHERMSNPESFFSMLGIGKPRDDYEMDVHNNKLGADLGSRTTSQAELEKLVRAMAMQSQNKQVEGKPWTMSKEQMKNRKGQITTQPPEYQKGGVVNALKGTKALDEAGKPVTAYRGEYGPSSGLSTGQGSYSFGTKDAANLYASSPNNSAAAIEAMKVFPAQLSIRKPVINTPGDAFVDLKVLKKALGPKEFDRVIKKNAGYVEGTNAFEELASAKGYTSVLDLMKKNPKDLDSLYMEIFPVLDDAKAVKAMQRKGYDGAIYGGSGATALEPEYRVFSASQAISPYGNKPMAPRSASQQFGDLLRSMEVSPTDALNFLGKAGGAAASALTPSTLNEGEDAELARRRTLPPTIDRAEGSPPEGELSQEEIDAASKPAFVTPKSGKGRKQGEISKQLKSGDAYVNMAKGLTEMPYNLAGAPMDLVMMARQGLTGQAPAGQVGTSDYIKSKMTALGIRPAPPSDPTSKGFYTAGDLLSNLTNPAGVTRSAVKGAQKTGEAATAVAKDFQEYNRQLTVPGASYAVRPTGSTMLSGPVGMQEDVSGIDKLLKSGLANATRIADQNEGQANIMRDFWDKKARNYFTRQFGTPDDPIARGIANKQIKGSALEEDFPEYMIDQIAAGKTRVKEGVRPEGFVGPGTPESRFFPKYPRAMDDFTARYDKATNLKGNLLTSDPAATKPEYSSLLSEQGKQLARTAQVTEEDKMIAQGLRPELINANVGTVARSPQNPENIIGDGTSSAEALFKAYQEANMVGKMNEPQKTGWINKIFGEGRTIMGKNEDEAAKNLLSENVMTAINKGEPVYDMQYGLQKPLQAVFDPISINKYLASLPPREAANIRFEDAVKGGLKMREQLDQRAVLVDRIKSGKPVADSVFAKGVSAPLLQFEEGPYKGFAWKRIEDRAATVPEGAYVGHSVGGYETGGAGYSADKREGFGTGKWQVYTLRDNRNRPVNTIEVKMLDEFTPVVTQIKGNGRASGNTAPEKYDGAVLDFLQKYLKPSSIEESDSHLTPLLQNYKKGLGPDPLDKLNFI